MTQINTLKQIAGGTPEPVQNATDIVGQNLMDQSESWLAQNSHLSPEVKLKQYETDVGGKWQFTANNKEYYWKTVGSLSTLNDQEYQGWVKKDIRTQLDNISTYEGKENFFRDNAHTWPSYAVKDLEEYFFNVRGHNDSKNLERTRITQSLEIEDLLKNKSFALNPEVSLATHTEDFIKAYDLGYTDEIKVDNNGRIAIPQEGEQTAVFSLPETNMGLEEKFISLNDLTPLVEKKLNKDLAETRRQVAESEELVKKSLLSRAETGAIPDQFVHNAIIDGASVYNNPMEQLRQSNNTRLVSQVKQGKFKSYGEMIHAYYSSYNTLKNKLERRITHGADS